MGADPVRIKRLAFGLAVAITALAGALLIIVGPVDPGLGRIYIGRTFCVVVLGGLGSVPRDARRRADPRRRRIDRALYRWRRLGAGGRLRHPAPRARGSARGPLRSLSTAAMSRRHGSLPDRCGGIPRTRLRPDAPGFERVRVLRGVRRAAVHRARDGVEHPGRLRGLRELRFGRLLRRRRVHRRCALQGVRDAAPSSRSSPARSCQGCWALPSARSPCGCAESSSRSLPWRSRSCSRPLW